MKTLFQQLWEAFELRAKRLENDDDKELPDILGDEVSHEIRTVNIAWKEFTDSKFNTMRSAIEGLLKFHPESPETGAELPRE